MEDFDLNRTLFVVKANSRILLTAVAMLIMEQLVDSYRAQKCVELGDLASIKETITALTALGTSKQDLINHICSSNIVKFEEFVTRIGHESMAEISSIKNIGASSKGSVKVRKFTVVGFFWHESFIFEFLDKLQKFCPGFLKILQVEINRFAKITTIRPAMKVDVVCVTYQK